MKRALSLVAALALALSLLPAEAKAASPAFGDDVWLKDTVLQDGVTYSENIFWSGGYAQPRHEYYITYTPGVGSDLPSSAGAALPAQPEGETPDLSWLMPGWTQDEGEGPQPSREEPAQPYTGVRPVASYGLSVCGRSTVEEAVRSYESQGYRVVGAINGDFYDTSTGFPMGMLVSGGQVLSSASGNYAVGFRPDGSVVMGLPELAVQAYCGERSVALSAVNKPRVETSGITLMTRDFRDDHTTGPSVNTPGVNVLASIVGGQASIGGALMVQVLEVAEDNQTRMLEEGQVLFTAAAASVPEGLEFLRSLTPGDLVSVSFTTPDPRWNEVTEAVGGYYLLVENGVAQEFTVSAAPRTAIGVKANGEVVLYALDGRQTDVSMGASLGVLAERMVELGCVTALALDGGGSTTAMAALPDSATAKLLNSPSDKVQRKVSNHILLLAPGGATGEAGGVYLDAAAPAVLAGHTVQLAANVTDTHYFPMDLPVVLSATAGEVADGVFTAPAQPGWVTVTAMWDGFYAQREILVVDAPDTLSLSGDGAASVTVQRGGAVQLSATAAYRHLPVEISPADLTWTVDPSLGVVDENGVFTATGLSGTGTVTASRGGVSASLPVTIEAGHPFVDLEGHPEEAYMALLYRLGVLAGESKDGQLYAYPERGISRAEFSVLLARYMQLDTASYEGTDTPFTDLADVESWAGGAIRAMYALGVAGGVTPDRFDPQSPLERAQAVAMIGRALGLEEASSPPEGEPELPDGEDSGLPSADLSQYTDAGEIPDYALAYFRVLAGMGAVEGIDGRLAPRESMTRGDVCKALAVLYGQ